MNDRMLICLPFVLAQECPFPNNWSNPHNFSNDAHDPGGKTMCGIIQREYDIDRKSRGESPRDVRKITQDEGYAIYEKSYWLPECPMLPPGMDLSFFDESVNTGPHEAIKILQRCVNAKPDGEWGPETEKMITTLNNPDAVGKAIEEFAVQREAYYHSLRGFAFFGNDWMRRSQTIRAQSRVMVGA